MLTNYLGKQALYRYSKACSLDPTNVDTSQDRVILAKEMGQMNIFSEAQTHADFDVDLAAGAAEIMEALGELREAWKTLFPPHPRPNFQDNGNLVVGWECTGMRPFWEEGCLEGREIEEKPEPLSLGDEDVVRVEYWRD